MAPLGRPTAHHRPFTAVAVALFALTTSACASKDAAQIVVVVSTDLDVPRELDGLHLELRDESGSVVESRDLTLDPSAVHGRVLGSFGIVPADGDVKRLVDVEVSAVLGSEILFGTRYRTRFLAEKKLRLDVFLAKSCITAACDAALTCIRGSCEPPVDVPPEELPPYDGESSDDAGALPAPDAGTDASTDAASDAGSVPTDSGVLPDSGSDAGILPCSSDFPVVFEQPPSHSYLAPAAVWTGDELGVAWADYDDTAMRVSLSFARVDLANAMRLDSSALHIESVFTGTTAIAGDPQLAFGSGEYLLVWNDQRRVPDPAESDVVYAHFAPGHEASPAIVRLTETTDRFEDTPIIAWSGSSAVLVWRRDYAFGAVAEIDLAGTRRHADVDLGTLSYQAIAWSPSANVYGLVYSDYVGGDNKELYFETLRPNGTPTSGAPPSAFTSTPWESVVPNIAVGDGEWGVSWIEGRGANDPWDVYFAKVDASGAVGPQVRLAQPTSLYDTPSIAWHPTAGYLVAYREGPDLHLVRIVGDAVYDHTLALRHELASRPIVVATDDGFALVAPDEKGLAVSRLTCP